MSVSFAKAGQPIGADELEGDVIILHVRTAGLDPGQRTIG
jgi:hypothetical protein